MDIHVLWSLGYKEEAIAHIQHAEFHHFDPHFCQVFLSSRIDSALSRCIIAPTFQLQSNLPSLSPAGRNS